MSERERAAVDSTAGMVRLFEQSRPPINELPALLVLLEEVASECAAALREIADIEFTITLKQVYRAPLNAAMVDMVGSVCSLFLIPEWNSQGVLSFSPSLLFQLLDAMYGGDNTQRGLAPDRELTQLERNIAGQIAMVLFECLRLKLKSFTDFGLRLVNVEQLTEASSYERNATDYILIKLLVGVTDEPVFLAVPTKGIELIRDHLTSSVDEASHDLDPNWRRQFQQSLGAATVDLVASCRGPQLLLCDVAKLKIGSTIEFDETCLQKVCLEAAGARIFEGRLGQLRGYFTICLEAPLDEWKLAGDGGQPRRRV